MEEPAEHPGAGQDLAFDVHCVELFGGNLNIYLYSLSFLNTEMVWVVYIFLTEDKKSFILYHQYKILLMMTWATRSTLTRFFQNILASAPEVSTPKVLSNFVRSHQPFFFSCLTLKSALNLLMAGQAPSMVGAGISAGSVMTSPSLGMGLALNSSWPTDAIWQHRSG